MKRRPATAVEQVSLLILVVILVVEIISFALVLWMPAPELPRYSVREVAQALAAPGVKGPAGVSVRIASTPDHGAPAKIVEQALALLLEEDPQNVQADWQAAGGGGAPVTIMNGDGRRGAPAAALLPLSDMPLPAFSAARRLPDGRWLVARAPRDTIAAGQNHIRRAIALSAIVLVPVAILAARRFTLPLKRLEELTRENVSGRRLPLRPVGPREVRAAFDAIVRMRDRLTTRAHERVRVLAAVAHDLRTPLTGLRLRIEDADEPDRSRMIDDVDRMERMVADMLAHARDDHARSSPVPVDVEKALARVTASFPPERVQLAPQPSPVGDLWIDPQDFERAICNLVQNAISYGDDALIEIAPTESHITIQIHDRGPGIPVDQWTRVLRPFERGDGSRSRHTGGVGLGLSSALDIARRYGGGMRFHARSPEGFTVAISFRRHQRAALEQRGCRREPDKVTSS